MSRRMAALLAGVVVAVMMVATFGGAAIAAGKFKTVKRNFTQSQETSP